MNEASVCVAWQKVTRDATGIVLLPIRSNCIVDVHCIMFWQIALLLVAMYSVCAVCMPMAKATL